MLQNSTRSSTDAGTGDIAIVGIACLFPGAGSPEQFWHNIINRVDCVTDPPPDWQPELFLDPTGRRDDRVYTGRGGYLGDLCRFNPAKYGAMPKSVEGSEPDQFIALGCAFDALADAGVPEIPINGERTGVILGRGTFVSRGYLTLLHHGFIIDQAINIIRQIDPERSEEQLDAIKAELKRNIPPLSSDTVPGLTHSVLVGRIANRLDLHGPAYTIDAACASSLLAVDAGVRELLSGRCDTVLAGGVAVSTPAVIDLLFCRLEALSRTGRIQPFSSAADGTLLGQGCGIVVLKRLRDAQQDGSRIYAVLKGMGISSDGRGGGLLAPLQQGQELALERAYHQTGLAKSSLELIEAHGTGIPLGDTTEMNSLRACFGTRVEPGPTIALGSVKSMISHLIPAAGIASLIKTALALYQRALPPTLHAENPAPELELEKTPFYLCTRPRPWVHGDRATPRRAGVNAFGFGGINAHAILEEHQLPDESLLSSLDRRWPVELVVVSAPDRGELRARAESLAAWAEQAKEVSLLDIAATCGGKLERSRLSICAKSIDDLVKKLRYAAELLGDPSRRRIQDRSGVFWYDHPLAGQGELAFVFPGEGAQYVNMLADLCLHFPQVRRQFDLTDEAFKGHHSRRLPSRLIFPMLAEDEQAAAELFEMDLAVEAVMTANRALLALLSDLAITPEAIVGHSSGEFTALLAAGAIDISDDEELIRYIDQGARCARRIINSGLVPRAVLTAVGGAGIKVTEQVVAESGGRLRIALDNCPHQLVLAGDEETTTIAVDQLRGKGAICQRVSWDRAYHTDAFAPACGILEDYCSSFRFRSPRVRLWSCSTTEPYPDDPASIGELMVRQWRCKVRFRETILAMHAAGVRIFLEVGPGGHLTAFTADTLAGQPHLAVAANVARKSGVEQLCRALAMLAAHGIPMNLEVLYRRRRPRALDFSAKPPAGTKQDPVLRLELPELKLREEVARALQTTGSHWPVPHGEVPAVSAPQSGRAGSHLVAETGASGESAIGSPEAARNIRARAFADFQETMRLFLETQRKFMNRLARARSGNGSGQISALAAASAITATGAQAGLPFIDAVLLHEPDTRIVVECELDVCRHRFLEDHAFGRTLSVNDPSLRGLIVMPLAMSIELMAEAAVTLRPTMQVTAVRGIRLLRWLAFDTSVKRVRMEARMSGQAEVQTTLYEVAGQDEAAAVATATIELGPARAGLGKARIQERPAGPSRWRAGEVYTGGLFHGPAFQAVVSVDARDDRSALATLQEPDPGLMFGDQRGGNLVLPAALIDGAGQVIGLWGGEPDLKMGFPSSVKRIEVGSGDAIKGCCLAAARIEDKGNDWSSDVEVRTDAGEVLLRLLGRVDQVVGLPPHIWRYRTVPRSVVFARELRGPFDDVPDAGHCTICELDDCGGPFLVEMDGIWALLLSRYILSRSERREFDNLKLPPQARASWLLGRVVAKDAVRVHRSLDLCMADVGIDTDRHGKPVVALPSGEPPLVSLAHTGYDAVAIVADASELGGVGIDLELLQPVDARVVADAFNSQERRLIDATADRSEDSSDSWYLSAWGAKEAVGKALGCGLLGGPRNIEVVDIDHGNGRLSMRLHGAVAEAAGRREDNPGGAVCVDAYRRLLGGRVIVVCLLGKRL